MANWDHLTNIGTHPVLDPDPAISLPAKIEAAKRRIATLQGVLADLEAQYADFLGDDEPPLEPGLYWIGPKGTHPVRATMSEVLVASRMAPNNPVTNYFYVEA